MTGPLTDDGMRQLILISRFSSPATKADDEETWIKKIPLLALVTRGVMGDTFANYDIAPSLIEYQGDTLFANISKEGEDDVLDMRLQGLVERLKLATKHHYYVSAYRVTKAGMDVVREADPAHHKAVDALLACSDCGGSVEVLVMPDNPYLHCLECGSKEKIHLFDIEEVPYVTNPMFPEIWLPK
jgi:hypothetical protein